MLVIIVMLSTSVLLGVSPLSVLLVLKLGQVFRSLLHKVKIEQQFENFNVVNMTVN